LEGDLGVEGGEGLVQFVDPHSSRVEPGGELGDEGFGPIPGGVHLVAPRVEQLRHRDTGGGDRAGLQRDRSEVAGDPLQPGAETGEEIDHPLHAERGYPHVRADIGEADPDVAERAERRRLEGAQQAVQGVPEPVVLGVEALDSGTGLLGAVADLEEAVAHRRELVGELLAEGAHQLD
jgi:hypothetical protein